ncbi:HdeD family acid-resistance protein [Levilactobacillus sp. N40-8-2]|uniref:HdeD family acid-resistance protein n=1 Tax=Levilactobacillus muriae TaxID=3238987 RepID=UPI0038B2EA21
MFNLNRTRWGFDWSEFILGILFLVAAFGLFRSPKIGLTGLAIIFAIMALLSGMTTIAGYSKLHEATGFRANFALVLGILDILIAVVFFFDMNSAIVTLGYLFALWFIVDSLERLLVASHLRSFGGVYFWLSIIFDVLALVVGIMLFVHPVVAALSLNGLIAIFFAIFGINAIWISIARSR